MATKAKTKARPIVIDGQHLFVGTLLDTINVGPVSPCDLQRAEGAVETRVNPPSASI